VGASADLPEFEGKMKEFPSGSVFVGGLSAADIPLELKGLRPVAKL
jgi:hypothetical protein